MSPPLARVGAGASCAITCTPPARHVFLPAIAATPHVCVCVFVCCPRYVAVGTTVLIHSTVDGHVAARLPVGRYAKGAGRGKPTFVAMGATASQGAVTLCGDGTLCVWPTAAACADARDGRVEPLHILRLPCAALGLDWLTGVPYFVAFASPDRADLLLFNDDTGVHLVELPSSGDS